MGALVERQWEMDKNRGGGNSFRARSENERDEEKPNPLQQISKSNGGLNWSDGEKEGGGNSFRDPRMEEAKRVHIIPLQQRSKSITKQITSFKKLYSTTYL